MIAYAIVHKGTTDVLTANTIVGRGEVYRIYTTRSEALAYIHDKRDKHESLYEVLPMRLWHTE